MLHYGMNYVNISSEIRVGIKREFRNCNFSHIFFNWNNSLIDGPTLVKFGTCIVKTHSGGTVSQIFIYQIAKLGSRGDGGKLEILDQKIKVKK